MLKVCERCACNGCMRTMPQGTSADCHQCDMCTDGDLFNTVQECREAWNGEKPDIVELMNNALNIEPDMSQVLYKGEFKTNKMDAFGGWCRTLDSRVELGCNKPIRIDINSIKSEDAPKGYSTCNIDEAISKTNNKNILVKIKGKHYSFKNITSGRNKSKRNTQFHINECLDDFEVICKECEDVKSNKSEQ